MTTAFQVATELYAVPATSASAPWLDGRPTTVLVAPAPDWHPDGNGLLRLVYFDAGDGPRYGLLDGGAVVELRGGLFSPVTPTGLSHALGSVSLLRPLGPDALGRVLCLLPGPGPRPGTAWRSAETTGEVEGPGGVIRIPPSAGTTVKGCIGFVVGGPECAQGVFGATAGLLVTDATGAVRVALGPSVVRGLAWKGLATRTRVSAGSECATRRGEMTSSVLHEALEVVARERLRRGDVLVVPQGAGIRPGPLVPAPLDASVEMPDVGVLSVRLLPTV